MLSLWYTIDMNDPLLCMGSIQQCSCMMKIGLECIMHCNNSPTCRLKMDCGMEWSYYTNVTVTSGFLVLTAHCDHSRDFSIRMARA